MQKHQKQSAANPSRPGFSRLAGIPAITFIAAIIITAFPLFGAKAESQSSYLAGFFKWSSSTEQSLIEPQNKSASNNLAPTAVNRTVCASGCDLMTIADAVAEVNASVPAGGVTYNVSAGHTETAPVGGYAITASGTATDQIIFRKNGAGANPTITAPSPQTAGVLHDAIFEILGGDWITIDGFTMLENPSNTTTTAASNNMTEFGVALFYATATNGAQNNTIQNNTIDLNRTYQNTFGIYSNNTHNSTSITGAAISSGASGANSGNKIYGNTITDVNLPIVFVGTTIAADQNDGLDIGGESQAQGNVITNWGTTNVFSGYLNVSGTVNGILVRNTKNYNISYNNIQSSNGGTTLGTLRGIFIPAFTAAPVGTITNTISNNSISVRSAVAGGTINGVNVEATTVNATTTLNINNNDFNNSGHTVAATGTITFISSLAAALNVNINGNTFTNLTVNTTNSVTFINKSVTHPANAVLSVNNNAIVTQFTKTGGGGTVQFYESFSTTPSTATENNIGNNFSNANFTGATTLTLWRSADGPTSAPFGPVKTVSNNTFSNIVSGTGPINVLTVTFGSNAGTNTISGNLISNISSGGAITGLTTGTTSGGSHNWTSNTIGGLSTTGATAVSGFVFNGTSATQNISKNRIYDLSGSNASSSVNGMLISTAPATANIFNNLIGDLRAPAANTTNAINGINITAATTSTTSNVSFNTVYLNATSSGTNFGSSALFHTVSGAATTSALNLRNNILVNLSTPNGTGLTVAYRRSGTTLTNYGASSNNNDFYAGTPAANRLIFYDGTNADQTLATYQPRVAPRDSASISENPNFLSTNGADPTFLHINPSAGGGLDNGGTPVSGIVDDYDGELRNESMPDIGADEIGIVPAAGTLALSSTTYSVNENEAGGTVTITVNRTGGDEGVVRANYTLANGTATGGASCAIPGVDFVNSGGVVVLGDGVGSQTFTVQICDDAAAEGNETFILTLSGATGGATIGSPDTATVTITDNDAPPAVPGTFQFDPTTYNVNENAGTATLTVTRTGGSDGAVDVTYTLANGMTNPATGGSECPISGTDYVNTGGTVSFGAGETSKTIPVQICDDAAIEGSENFTVTLTGATNGGTIGSGATATVTINDNDVAQPGIIVFSMANYTVGESAGTATITVNRTGGDDGEISANYSTSNGTATAGTCSLPPLNAANGVATPDYQSASGTITFNDGDTTPKTFTVTICDDSIDEPDETVNLTLSSGGNQLGGAQTTATLTITDNDEPSPPSISVNSPSVNETDAANTYMTFTFSLSAASSQTVTVGFQTADGTATAGEDYTPTTGTVTFLPGDTEETFQIPVFGDTVPEADEMFTVNLSNPVNATISTGTGTGTILNDDTYPTVQFSSATYTVTEGLSGARQVGDNQLATITVTRSGNTSGTSSVNYATSNGTATGDIVCSFADFRHTTGTLTFAAGETSKSFTVEICSDSTPEGDETVNLTLSEPVLATLGTPNTAVLTINDNDTPPPATTVQFDAAAYETDEGDDIIIVNVTRSGDTSGSSTVNYAASNGTATGGSCQSVGFDYQIVSGTLNFGPGDTSTSFSFEICADTQSENPPETVNLTLSSPSGATLGTQSTATVNIIDAATQFRNPNPVSIPEESTVEFVGQASTSVTVSGAGTNPSRVRVTLFGLTHASPDDLDMLLVSPTGQKFVLVGDAGGANAANNLTLTFEDAATTPLPDATALASGNYKPANHEAVPDFFAPAPAGPYTEPGTTGTGATLNATFSGNPNGTWTLYLRDDTVNGNTGTLAGGFGLEFIAPTAAAVTISGRVTRPNGQGLAGVVVSLTNSGAGGRRYAITSSFGYYTFEGITAGDVYIISATSKRYTFNPSSHVIIVQEEVSNLNFISEQ